MRFILCIALTCLDWNDGWAQDSDPAARYTVTGTVLDANEKPLPRSIVIPLSEFGVPLNGSDATPATMNSVQQAEGKDFVLFTQTDEQGVFSLELPPGQYRIVAQSWLDQAQVTGLLEKNGSRLRIDGYTELQFASEMEAAETVEIRPVGNGSIKLSSQESGDLVLISSEPLAGDPALGFLALTGGFWSGLLGGTRMEEKEILISGLPEGELQFYSFVNDNNGGWGGVRATVVPGRIVEAYLPLIAGWSNGHRTPPAELEDLVTYFNDNPAESGKLNEFMAQLLKQYLPDDPESQQSHRFEAQLKLAEHLQDEYKLANGETVTLADAMAASAYHRMKR